MAATAAGSYALVGDAGAAGGAAATTTSFEGEAQRAVVHRVPPPPAAPLRGLQVEGRGVITRGRAEASGHEGRGAEARDWAGGGGWVQVCEQRCSRRGERELERTGQASRAEVRWHA